MDPIRVEIDLTPSAYEKLGAFILAKINEGFTEKMRVIQNERIKHTRKEAAKRLRISLPTLDKHIAEGLIKSQRLGKRILIPEIELENFLNRGK